MTNPFKPLCAFILFAADLPCARSIVLLDAFAEAG